MELSLIFSLKEIFPKLIDLDIPEKIYQKYKDQPRFQKLLRKYAVENEFNFLYDDKKVDE